MKKILSLLIVLSLLLSGCGNNTPEDSQTENLEVTNSVQTDPVQTQPDQAQEYMQQPMAAVSLPLVTESQLADDESVISTYTYQNIHLFIQDQQVADTIILDFLNRQDRHHSSAQTVASQALSQYTGQSNWVPYLYKTTFAPGRIDHSVLSLYGQNVIYSGGNHPAIECTAANYSMITGEVLTLGSILTDVSALETLCQLTIDQAELIVEDYQLFDDYPEVITQRFAREESYDEDWYFSSSGLNFYFEPYEIAPYISGVVVIDIPYAQLTGVIIDSYFPAEEDQSTGTIVAKALDEVKLGDFTQIADVTADTDGDYVFLFSEGLVRDVRIEIGTWNENFTVYTPSDTIFATYTLTPGDGILLQANITESAPTIRVTYRSADETISKFITRNGHGGAIVLL